MYSAVSQVTNLIKCLKGQKSQRLKVFSKCIYHCLCHCLCLCHRHCLCLCICLRRCLFGGQVMFSHKSDQMSQRSKVFWRCSLNVFIIVFVIIFVFVFVFAFIAVLLLSFCWSGQVFPSIWSNVSKAKSLKDCSLKVFSKCICHCHCLCHCFSLCRCLFGQVLFFSSLIKCLKGQKSRRSLFEGVL